MGPRVDARVCVLTELYVETTRAERQEEFQSANARDDKSAPSAEPRGQFVTAAMIAEGFVPERLVWLVVQLLSRPVGSCCIDLGKVVCAVGELCSRPVDVCRFDTNAAGGLGESSDGWTGSRDELGVLRWMNVVLHR